LAGAPARGLGIVLAWALMSVPVWTAIAVVLCSAALATETADRARELMASGESAQAESLLQDVLKTNPRDHEAAFLLGKISMREQEYGKAVEYAEKAVEIADSMAEYHLQLARALLAKTFQSGMIGAFLSARKGKSEYERAIALDATNAEARFELCMYYLIAPGMVGGSKEKAKEHASVLQSQNPLFGSYAWAGVHEKEQNMAKAESLYNVAVGLDTSSTSTALYGLAYFYERHQKYDQSTAVFRQIVCNRPDDLNALFQMGRAFVVAKINLEDAEAAFIRYLSEGPAPNGPEPAAAHWRLGMVYDLQGRREDALAELHKAVDLSPDNKQYRGTLKDVEKRKL
jgi:tetratricopeptide (TPR) repeat protein